MNDEPDEPVANPTIQSDTRRTPGKRSWIKDFSSFTDELSSLYLVLAALVSAIPIFAATTDTLNLEGYLWRMDHTPVMVATSVLCAYSVFSTWTGREHFIATHKTGSIRRAANLRFGLAFVSFLIFWILVGLRDDNAVERIVDKWWPSRTYVNEDGITEYNARILYWIHDLLLSIVYAAMFFFAVIAFTQLALFERFRSDLPPEHDM